MNKNAYRLLAANESFISYINQLKQFDSPTLVEMVVLSFWAQEIGMTVIMHLKPSMEGKSGWDEMGKGRRVRKGERAALGSLNTSLRA